MCEAMAADIVLSLQDAHAPLLPSEEEDCGVLPEELLKFRVHLDNAARASVSCADVGAANPDYAGFADAAEFRW